MAHLVKWTWSIDRYVRAYLKATALNEHNLRFTLPDANCPMTAVVSRKLVHVFERAPEPLVIADRHIRQGVLLACEHLFCTYAGADLKSILIDSVRIQMSEKGGARFAVPAVIVWDRGTFGVFTRSELELAEDFYAEKVLLLTEIQHHAEELEE